MDDLYRFVTWRRYFSACLTASEQILIRTQGSGMDFHDGFKDFQGVCAM